MNLDFVVYAPTGRILRVGSCNAYDLERQAADGEHVCVGVADEDAHFVDPASQVVLPKMTMAAVLEQAPTEEDDGLVVAISGLPPACVITINEVDDFPVTGSAFGITFRTPGAYQLDCRAPCYRKRVFLVEVE